MKATEILSEIYEAKENIILVEIMVGILPPSFGIPSFLDVTRELMWNFSIEISK